VVAPRTVVGLQKPTHGYALISIGLVVVAVTAVLPVLGGGVLLDQSVFSFDIPVIGKIKSGSALPFDIGVTLIVVGLVVAVLDGLGADELASTPEVQRRP
jgi:multicomponent Na+:H+ antiporter subunit A